jgi:hypothetical protein
VASALWIVALCLAWGAILGWVNHRLASVANLEATPAALRTPLAQTTWVLWRYDWPFQHGQHTFTVRCYEGNGTPQIEQPAPMEPDGAAGLYSKNQML